MSRLDLVFCIFYLLKCPSEIVGNGVSETLNLKIFLEGMPPDHPSLEGLRCSIHSSCAYTFKSRATPLKLIVDLDADRAGWMKGICFMWSRDRHFPPSLSDQRPTFVFKI